MSDFSRVMEVAREVTPPPVNVDVPHVLVDGAVADTAMPGSTLTCTMGNWEGEPSAYDFRWRSAGVDVGGGGAYVVRAEDDGHTVDCMVTATNIGGSTSIPSNSVTVGTPATQSARRKT
jgi:hypothetical protein